MYIQVGMSLITLVDKPIEKPTEGGEIEMGKSYKPGEKAPASGQYKITGPRGGDTGEERTAVRGKPLPPPPKPGQRYEIADRTKNKSGRA